MSAIMMYKLSIPSVILKCEWGLSVTQEALVTSVSGNNVMMQNGGHI